jgi:hypothetical protein
MSTNLSDPQVFVESLSRRHLVGRSNQVVRVTLCPIRRLFYLQTRPRTGKWGRVTQVNLARNEEQPYNQCPAERADDIVRPKDRHKWLFGRCDINKSKHHASSNSTDTCCSTFQRSFLVLYLWSLDPVRFSLFRIQIIPVLFPHLF